MLKIGYLWIEVQDDKCHIHVLKSILQGSICKDYIAISCCPAFAICQMLRELDDMGL